MDDPLTCGFELSSFRCINRDWVGLVGAMSVWSVCDACFCVLQETPLQTAVRSKRSGFWNIKPLLPSWCLSVGTTPRNPVRSKELNEQAWKRENSFDLVILDAYHRKSSREWVSYIWFEEKKWNLFLFVCLCKGSELSIKFTNSMYIS